MLPSLKHIEKLWIWKTQSEARLQCGAQFNLVPKPTYLDILKEQNTEVQLFIFTILTSNILLDKP